MLAESTLGMPVIMITAMFERSNHICFTIIAFIILMTGQVRAAEPEYDEDLYGLTEITAIFLEDNATDGCWPNPKVTKNLVIARLKAAGLSGVTPRPELPEYGNWGDPDYEE